VSFNGSPIASSSKIINVSNAASELDGSIDSTSANIVDSSEADDDIDITLPNIEAQCQPGLVGDEDEDWAERAYDGLDIPDTPHEDEAVPVSEFESKNAKIGDIGVVSINSRGGIYMTVQGILKYHLGSAPKKDGSQFWRCSKNRGNWKCGAVCWTTPLNKAGAIAAKAAGNAIPQVTVIKVSCATADQAFSSLTYLFSFWHVLGRGASTLGEL